MKTVFTLTSSESKRLIAKAVVQMPEFKKAKESAYILIAGGTTTAFVAQETLGRESINPALCAVGISTSGVLCVTNPDRRSKMFPIALYKGETVEKTMEEALADFHKETIVIKGANAVDTDGFVGIVTAGFDGGTIAKVIGPVTSAGLKIIVPIGLEKLVPSVPEACRAVGARDIDISLGADFGLFCLAKAIVVTELDAIDILFGLDAVLVCCGGVGGNQGAVTIAADGDEQTVTQFVEFLEKEIKGEPPIENHLGICEECRYSRCRYHGLKKEALPFWMKE